MWNSCEYNHLWLLGGLIDVLTIYLSAERILEARVSINFWIILVLSKTPATGQTYDTSIMFSI